MVSSEPGTTWRLGDGRSIDLSAPVVMGILNVTPDSFSDGGRYTTAEAAADRAIAMLDQGATIVDVGGESTRPGAPAVAAQEQIARVVPAIRGILARRPDALVSIDTTRADVAQAAADAGATIVNDVSGGTDDGRMLPLVARHGLGYVLMHRVTAPERDAYSDAYRRAPIEGSAVPVVLEFFRERIEACAAAGASTEALVLDPGLGFGKTVEQNLELIRRTPELRALGRPVLSGLSRKSFVGRVTLDRDSDPAERLAGTLALTALHRGFGAGVFRVHDVADALAALRAADAMLEPSGLTR